MIVYECNHWNCSEDSNERKRAKQETVEEFFVLQKKRNILRTSGRNKHFSENLFLLSNVSDFEPVVFQIYGKK
uniref:Bm1259 n=1 Tax=Brugia malayi TaxID=6279 RepID=A0A1I9G1E4_BRUMA|nr:Bm1259 [Brugia malayi]